jgi:hypothetical protein
MSEHQSQQKAVREKWTHDGGFFVHTKDDSWEETSPDGRKWFFKVIQKTDDCITLEDKSRPCEVKLYRDRCDVDQGESGNFRTYYRGQWDK